MSQQDRRDHDSSELSTSSELVADCRTHGSTFGRTSCSRPQESSVKEGLEYAVDPSSSTHLEQHGVGQMEIEVAEGGGVDCRSGQHDRCFYTETMFISRPSTLISKKGTSGEQIRLQTNCFKLTNLPNLRLHKYRVDFEPEEDCIMVRKGLLSNLMSKIFDFWEDVVYTFDGTVLCTPAYFPKESVCESIGRKAYKTKTKISVRLVGDMSQNDSHYIQVFNTIIRRRFFGATLYLKDRNYASEDKISIHEYQLELWLRHVTAIRQYEHNVLMCCEITPEIKWKRTILDLLNDCYKYDRQNVENEFCKKVVGLVVHTRYNTCEYRVEDVHFDANPSSTFTYKYGVTSHHRYYRMRYEIVIKDLKQPMLVTRTESKGLCRKQGDLFYLVPELCYATGLSNDMRNNFQLMQELSEHIHISPEKRIRQLRSFNERIRNFWMVNGLRSWGMTLDANLVEVNGRVLPNEKLIFNRNVTINTMSGDWSRNMQRAPLLRSKELKNWFVIGCERDRQNIENFVRKLLDVSRGISFYIEYPRMQWIRDDKSSTYTDNLEYILSKYVPDLVFCVVTDNQIDQYVAIKKKCCIDRPVPSQVFLQRNLACRDVVNIATKVAIQMNCKLGGAAWGIENPLRGLITIGFDVYHDTCTKGKNFLAMVATVDRSLTQYYSATNLFNNNEELAELVCAGIIKAVQIYRANNKALPMYLLIYRDGVREGEVSEVFESEVGNLKKKLEELYHNLNFKMAFIIVSKKINTRLFNRRENPPVGTVVDDVITSPFKYDFFLVSHFGQGTTSPTLYNVIYDNTGLNPDMIQRVTFKLTHLYYNCLNTVRVPAICHYAQKLSFLVGKYLHRPPHTQLENQLFFL